MLTHVVMVSRLSHSSHDELQYRKFRAFPDLKWLELKCSMKRLWPEWNTSVSADWGTWFMWTCWWYCFCFSTKLWCCCWRTSWASVLWGSGADWVRLRGRCRGSLGREPPPERSFITRGDWGRTETLPGSRQRETEEREMRLFSPNQ